MSPIARPSTPSPSPSEEEALADTSAEPKRICVTTFALPYALVEQVYDRRTRESGLWVFEPQRTRERVPTVSIPSLNLELHPVENDLIHHGRVILPEAPRPYGSTADLVEAVRRHIRRYVVLPEEMEDIAVHYVLLTWVYDRFETVPYLRFIGDLGVGKSRALKVVGQLCYHPFMAAGSATMAPIFRSLDMLGGATLVMDEVDFYQRNETHQEMMTMLRQGFQKGYGVLRAEASGDSFEPRDYEVFGPKTLAGRRNFPDAALESRCLRIYMQAGVPLGAIPTELPATYLDEVVTLQGQLLHWRFDHFFAELRTPEPLDIEPRLRQLYDPLAAVIDDPTALRRLKRTMEELEADMTEMRNSSLEGRTLAALVAAYETDGRGPGPLNVQVKALVGPLMDEGRKVTSKTLAGICRGFGMVVGKNKYGAYVEFNPAEHSALLTRYGLVEASSPGPHEVAA